MPSTTATARSIQARVKNTSRGCGTGGPEDIQKWNTAMASQASAPRIRSTAKATKRSPRAFMAREHKRKLLRVVDARVYFLFRPGGAGRARGRRAGDALRELQVLVDLRARLLHRGLEVGVLRLGGEVLHVLQVLLVVLDHLVHVLLVELGPRGAFHQL